MKTQHTQGPWEIRGTYEFNRRVVFGAGGDICLMALKPRGQVETEANTALISAAPELLDLIKTLRPQLVKAGFTGPDIEKMTDLIDKAEGK